MTERDPTDGGLAFHDTFDDPGLDTSKWLPHYLPHWSSRGASAARYDLDGGRLQLRIDEDQEPWCPEVDGSVRVSSLQTGCFSGPAGTRIGQHRFDPRLRVREPQPTLRLFTPTYGRIETRIRAIAEPGYMTALWLIGFEDRPENSGEICVCEVFGHEMTATSSVVGFGIHPFHDDRLHDEFFRPRIAIDPQAFHVYAADWTPGGIDFFVDGRHVGATAQAPGYPFQLMLGLYELPAFLPTGGRTGPWPKTAEIDYVRVFRQPAAPDGAA